MTKAQEPALELTCSVCNSEPAVGVGAVPGVPVSEAYGRECLNANAHPWWVLVAHTAALSAYHPEGAPATEVFKRSAQWWQVMVADTIDHLGDEYTWKRFFDEVAEAIETMLERERAYREEMQAEGGDEDDN